MRKITEITCTCCSRGCVVCVDESNGNAVSGNGCRNGAAFAIHELSNPKRRVGGEVRVVGADTDRCPVKTDRAVSKDDLPNIARELQELQVEAPIFVSQVLVSDLCGTGANLVACATIPRAEENAES